MNYWWIVFISWMKINNCYHRFRINFSNKFIRCDNLSLIDYANKREPQDYMIWSFNWSCSKEDRAYWRKLNDKWVTFYYNKSEVIKHDKNYIKRNKLLLLME